MVLLPVLFILLRLLLNPGKIPTLAVQKESFSFNGKRMLTLAIFLLTICAWLFSSRLASFFGISKSFDTIIAVSAVLILSACRLVSWKDIDRATDCQGV